ncbi:MAG TPA: POTRA domain-containing protein [Acidobacteriaceae bacterium]
MSVSEGKLPRALVARIGRRAAVLWVSLLWLGAAASLAGAQGTVNSSSAPPAPAAPAKGPGPQQTLPNAARLPGYDESAPMTAAKPDSVAGEGTENLRAWRGLQVAAVRFVGVSTDRLEPLPSMLDLQPGHPLDPQKVRSSLRRLYATGLYQTIDIEGTRQADSVTLIFHGTPQVFLGRVTIRGVKQENFSSLLESATKLSPGTPFSPDKLARAERLLKETLEANGYYQATIKPRTENDPAHAQVNVFYDIAVGKQARVGNVVVEGNSGLTPEKFRKKAKLKRRSKVSRDTVNTALAKLRANYQKQQLLQSSVTLDTKTFQPPVNQIDYAFKVNQGPKVLVKVEGVKMSKGRIRNLVPVYEEGAVDEDLLNEGNRRIHDIYQREGYFNVQVTHDEAAVTPGQTVVTYHVAPGALHDVDSVNIHGNKYFATTLITPRLNVHPASIFEHRGIYSQALVASDVATIRAIYEGSGFSNVKVTPVVKDSPLDKKGRPSKISHLTVNYEIVEGIQQRFGTYTLVGNNDVPTGTLTPLLSTQVGQPYNSNNLTNDRAQVLTYYLGHGYDQASVTLKQLADPKDPNLIDVTMNISEGEQIFVKDVVVSGLHYTRPRTVAPHILVHPGDVLDQSALIDTQRQLYDLTLFNGVNTAVQNPNGDELRKDVLLQFREAKRWDVNYGFGFQVQTGTPSCNIYQRIQLGQTPTCANSANGQFGASGLVEVDVSRINLRGSDNSLTLKTAYGSLEKRAVLTYADPRFLGRTSLTFQLSGGYTDARDVSTYAASRLEGTARLSQRLNRPTTLIYQMAFRRVKVDPNTLQIDPSEIPIAAASATVGGPGITWIRDTRRPSALDGQGGTYNTVQEFFSDSHFGAASNFNRFDGTNSTYYSFGNVHHYIFARSTRIAWERSYGTTSEQLIPIPERIYGGGAQSHRGFGINAAGPRDSETGFPIGGAAAFINNFELRLPPPTLPYVGDSVSFVLFHDMGNVFVKGSDIWPSFLRFRQPDRAGCRDTSRTDQQQPNSEKNSIGLNGLCSYNYFSHAIGIGARYRTPIGPIRVDTSYNLNPPLYPQPEYYNNQGVTIPRYSQAPHINFFFSIGQAF